MPATGEPVSEQPLIQQGRTCPEIIPTLERGMASMLAGLKYLERGHCGGQREFDSMLNDWIPALGANCWSAGPEVVECKPCSQRHADDQGKGLHHSTA